MQDVQVARDYGTDVEIASGLSGGELIVTNPGDATVEDVIVVPKLAEEPATEAKPPQGIQSPSMQAPTKGAGQQNKK